jgi:hypothetical protein
MIETPNGHIIVLNRGNILFITISCQIECPPGRSNTGTF